MFVCNRTDQTVMNGSKVDELCAGCIRMTSQPELYSVAIGSQNRDYYLRYFERADAAGKAPVSWHWPAFFVTFAWLLYRKMWALAALYYFAPLIFAFFLGTLIALVPTLSGPLTILFYIVVLFAPPMFANALYYRHCRKLIEQTALGPTNTQAQLGALAVRGGTSVVGVIVGGVIPLIAVLGILAAIALPAYQDYTIRAKLSASVVAAYEAKLAVSEFYSLNHAMPDSLAAAGVATAPTVPGMKEIAFNKKSGALTITYSVPQLAGSALLLVPSVDADQKLVWRCTSREIRERWLPKACRQPE